jgi:hypothetical protein
VNHDLVVEVTEQNALVKAGLATASLVLDVVHVARRGWLVAAAGPPAVLVSQLDRVADRGRDVVAETDIQRQARPGWPGAELTAAQIRCQAGRTGQEGHSLADDVALKGGTAARGRRYRRGLWSFGRG